MAAQLHNNNNGNNDRTQMVIETLQDYGIPSVKVLQIARAYATSTDYLRDVESFLYNYKKFQTLQNAASSLDMNLVEQLTNDKYQQLIKTIQNKESWDYLCGILPNSDEIGGPTTIELKQKAQLEKQMKELNEFKKKWGEVFASKETMQAKADEILTRNRMLKLIELGIVFKDVCIGINQVIQTNKKMKLHRQELERISREYVEPVMQTFEKNGSVDTQKIDTALMQLRYIKTQCQVERKDTAKSWFAHASNAIAMGLQAWSSFGNASAMTDVASKWAVNSTYAMAAAQGTLSFGSCVLSGVEGWNWIKYGNLIDDINEIMHKLEYYNNQVQRIAR